MHSREVFHVFHLVTCKTSQTVTFHNYWYGVNLKFHVNHHYSVDAKLYGLFFLISLDFNFSAVKINEAVGKII